MHNIRVGIIVAAIIVAAQASGHHSEAGFDDEAVVILQGTVTGFNWKNPHTYLTIETTDERGEMAEWEVETGSTVLLARSGWTAESLRLEERITVRANPTRDGRPYALLLSLEKADGSVLEQRTARPRATGRASSLSGVWKGSTAPEGLFERWMSKPLTERGIEAQERFDINSENPSAQCVPDNSPLIVAVAEDFLTEIDIREDGVLLRSERYDVERTVFMDGRGHPEDAERTNQGHSIGWWEGNTLVVDTTHFADHRNPYMDGISSGPQKHVVERYTLSEDGSQIAVDVFLEDPEYLAAPFTFSLKWNYRPDLELLRYDCDVAIASQYIPQ